jgi:Tfp pilus assembly protein FimT
MNRPRFSKPLLIKILVFVFVVLVVVVDALPSLVRLTGRRRIDEATQVVCGRILLTRQKAIAGRTCYRIHYDYETGASATYRETSPGRWIAEISDAGGMPEGVAMSPTSTPTDGYIEIGADGTISNHGVPVVIRFVDGDGTQRSIRVSPAGMIQEVPAW